MPDQIAHNASGAIVHAITGGDISHYCRCPECLCDTGADWILSDIAILCSPNACIYCCLPCSGYGWCITDWPVSTTLVYGSHGGFTGWYAVEPHVPSPPAEPERWYFLRYNEAACLARFTIYCYATGNPPQVVYDAYLSCPGEFTCDAGGTFVAHSGECQGTLVVTPA